MPFGLIKLIPYPGGKKLSAKRIVKAMPEHRTYVEPFFGGGSVFFSKADKKPARRSVLNDSNCMLMSFYKGVAHGDLRKCKNVGSMNEVDLVKRGKAIWKKKNSKKLTACEYLIISKGSYGGDLARGKPSFPGQGHKARLSAKTAFSKLNEYEKALKAANITCGDFAKTMKKHDSKDTLHYLDPPYLKTTKMYKNEGVTPRQIKTVTDKLKGKIMLSYNKIPEVEKLFCKRGRGAKSRGRKGKKYYCYGVGLKHQYGMGTNWEGPQSKQELLITNFPLTKRSKGHR